MTASPNTPLTKHLNQKSPSVEVTGSHWKYFWAWDYLSQL